jgi:putative transposase
MEFAEEKQMPTDIIHDADTKFTKQFDEIFKAEGIRVKRLLPRCPNMNAYVERFIQTLKQECLDHFVVLGEKHLSHVVSEFVKHYHEERPHQGIENVPIMAMTTHKGDEGEIVCRERLGGLLKHYARRAA